MASEELIALVAEAIVDNPPIETMTDDEIIIDWSPTVKAAISTILAALQAHLEVIKPALNEPAPSLIQAYLESSPLGEQSE